MRKHHPAICCFVLLLTLVLLGCAFAETETRSFRSYNEAMKYVKENRPSDLDIGSVRYDPRHLLALLEQMGEGAVLHFSTVWDGTAVSDESTELNLDDVGKFTLDHLEALLRLCPNLRKVEMSKHSVNMKKMASILESHPEIEFVWQVKLDGRHGLASDATAYSTFHEPDATHKMTSSALENLKYVPGLKALDLGHNEISSLDWLQYCPDLELLILGDNKGITDLTPIGNLKNLQYLELFMLNVTDISPLANCTELLDLNLSTCLYITDLSPLGSLQKLERFWGNRMKKVSQEEQDAFIAGHPGTEVHFKGQHATSDGWREHERYKHFIWCLKHRQWIPFSEPIPEP